MTQRTYAVLVTYNPNVEKIKLAVPNFLKQVDYVVICNNSSFEINFSLENIHVFNFHDNLGIAKAQSIGMDWAFNNGADFILLLDQDSEPTDGMVHRLVSSYNSLRSNGVNVGLVGIQMFNKSTSSLNHARLSKGKAIKGTPYRIVSESVSSGSLIPRSVYQEVGGMDDKLFIDGVDLEYCWRIRAHGYLVIKNTSAFLNHRLGDRQKRILGLILVNFHDDPIRHYYLSRNVIHLMSRSYAPLRWKLSSCCKVLFKLIFYPIFLDHGRARFGYMIKGIYAGISGKYGRIDKETKPSSEDGR